MKKPELAGVVLVYHPGYIFGSKWLDWLHPFRFDRAKVALARLESEVGGERVQALLRQPDAPLTLDQCSPVHDQAYLASLNSSSVVCSVLEVPPLLALCPRRWIRRWFVTPTLWGAAGSLLAARAAMQTGLGFNLGGGFHHAKRHAGEGFCLISDIALCVETLRREDLLSAQSLLYYIDLDVHQGNGVSHYYGDDPNVRIMDVYNHKIYPCPEEGAVKGVDIDLPLEPDCPDGLYLSTVESGLAALFEGPTPALVIYNAGTDIYREDSLGGLSVSREGVNQRDAMVLRAARSRGIPLLVLASGGYSDESATLLADFARMAIQAEEKAPSQDLPHPG